MATFVIVPAHAAEVYGVAESGYFQRYGALGDSPLDIFKSFFTQPGLVWQIASEPARIDYLLGLLAPFGFLSLLAPEILLLALPVLLANLLSAYPAQYYGDFHYSAPLVPYFAVAAAYGLGRLWRWLAKRIDGTSASFQQMPAANSGAMAAASLLTNSRTAIRPLMTVALVGWILCWAGWSYLQQGAARWARAMIARPSPLTMSNWPTYLAQIPKDAAVTATAAVHPHLSHRQYVYQFPLGLDSPVPADWALLDVTTNTDMAPGDLKARVDEMLAGNWGVVDAGDGFLLLATGAADKEIPDDFYSFVRARDTAMNEATGAADDSIDLRRLRDRRLATLASDQGDRSVACRRRLRCRRRPNPFLEVRSPAGDTVGSLTEVQPPSLVWYPPERWQPDETVRITSLPLYLPQDVGIGDRSAAGICAHRAGGVGQQRRGGARDCATTRRTRSPVATADQTTGSGRRRQSQSNAGPYSNLRNRWGGPAHAGCYAPRSVDLARCHGRCVDALAGRRLAARSVNLCTPAA